MPDALNTRIAAESGHAGAGWPHPLRFVVWQANASALR
jgi:hypothetical protein